MAAQPHPQPTPEQQAVNKKHWHDDALFTEADAIVKKDTTFQPTSAPSQYLISTTKNSRVLIAMNGLQGLIYNSFSSDEINPWLINKFPQQSCREFREELNDYWAKDAKVPADLGIRPFRVYEWNENASKWKPCDLEVDHVNKVVRARVKDQEFWCHPPRPFQVLENACNAASDDNRYKQIKGNLSKIIKDWKNVDTNTKIPEDRKPERKNTLEASIKSKFFELYELVEALPWHDDSQLTSYHYPTLQMGADRDYQPGAATRQRSQNMNRFGGYSSGVYGADDNEVHYQFMDEEGTEPIPKPTKEVFWNWVVNSLNITNPPTYHELFQE